MKSGFFSKHSQAERIQQQQTLTMRNVKGSPLRKGEITSDRNVDLHKGTTNTENHQNGHYKGKYVRFLSYDLNLFKRSLTTKTALYWIIDPRKHRRKIFVTMSETMQTRRT